MLDRVARHIARGSGGRFAGFLSLLLLSAVLAPARVAWPAEDRAAIERLEREIAVLEAERTKHERNITRMRAEFDAAKRERRRPRGELLSDHYATATGDRTEAYHGADAAIRKLVDAFEANFSRNAGHSVALMTGGANSFARFAVEIDRSSQFIEHHLNPRIAELEREVTALKNPYLDDELRDLLAESEADTAAAAAERERDQAVRLGALQAAVDALRPRVERTAREYADVATARLRYEDDVDRYDVELDALRARAMGVVSFATNYGETVSQSSAAARETLRAATAAVDEYAGTRARLEGALQHPALPPVCSASAPSDESVAALRVLAGNAEQQGLELGRRRRELSDVTVDLAHARDRIAELYHGWLESAAPLKTDDLLSRLAIRQKALEDARSAISKRARTVARRVRDIEAEIDALESRLASLGGEFTGGGAERSYHERLVDAVAALRGELANALLAGEPELEAPSVMATDLPSGAARYEGLANLERELVAAHGLVTDSISGFDGLHARAEARRTALGECLARLEAGDSPLAAGDAASGCAAASLATARQALARFETAVALPAGGSDAGRASVETIIDARRVIEERALQFCETMQRGRQQGYATDTRARLRQPAADLDAAWQALNSHWQAIGQGAQVPAPTGHAVDVEAQRQRAEAAVKAAAAEMMRQSVQACSEQERRELDEVTRRYDALARRVGDPRRGVPLRDVAEPYFEAGQARYREALTCLKVVIDDTASGESLAAGPGAAAAPDCADPKRPHVVDGRPTCPCRWKDRDTMVYHPPTQQCQTKFFASMYEGSMKLKKAVGGARSTVGKTVEPAVEYGRGPSDLPDLR